MLYLFSNNAAAQYKNSTIMQFLYTPLTANPIVQTIGESTSFNRKKDYIFTTADYFECIKQASKNNFKVMMVDRSVVLKL